VVGQSRPLHCGETQRVILPSPLWPQKRTIILAAEVHSAHSSEENLTTAGQRNSEWNWANNSFGGGVKLIESKQNDSAGNSDKEF
jgi:hypothetical protein